jgi:ketosteroid isomerase-like protein
VNRNASPSQIVKAFFEAMAGSDPLDAKSKWAVNAVWHLTGSHELARDYTRDEYFHMLDAWHSAYPSYKARVKEVRDYGDQVAVVLMESKDGMAPGAASGILVYRVVDGTIREGWGIPTFESGRYPF